MTLYYSIVFALLVFEMAMFMVLIVPLPFSARRKLFQFLATSEVVAKINYSVRITFIFVAVLFIDAFQRMMKVSAEAHTPQDQKGFTDYRSETNYHAKKFYAQRNVYLTGFTLFLSLILARTHSLVLDLINAQEELASSIDSGAVDKQSKIEIETLRKQVDQQQKEYNRLSDELAKAKSEVSDKKSD
ncbi:Endoplasmic reticulum transmembrane protein 3 [Malassezia brasiliensis]|uniref:Endoplasmic reticulum transmembrane protein n=1 Tax=Malassezia brasiliensis TaxID=1821822 RepID=A0AAF0DT18_9BASI|nr:Endoplasmic reticulum transmembrane protein 3 [Malassezia brasiliensis]